MQRFKIELPRKRLLPKVKLPKIVLPKLWNLPRRLLLRERVLPQIDLPHVLVDFPEEITVPWKEMEIERVEVVPLKPRDLKIIFRRIPVAERHIGVEATP